LLDIEMWIYFYDVLNTGSGVPYGIMVPQRVTTRKDGSFILFLFFVCVEAMDEVPVRDRPGTVPGIVPVDEYGPTVRGDFEEQGVRRQWSPKIKKGK
jgi:hypothetical protein